VTDLTTTYLGMTLRSPLVASPSPLTGNPEMWERLEAAGAGAIVLPSLFEEQIEHESFAVDFALEQGSNQSGEALSYLPEMESYDVGPSRHLALVEQARERLGIPVIASLNGTSPGGWVRYARHLVDAGAHAIELNLYDVVVEGLPLGDVLQPCPDVPNLWCAPATIDLAGAEIELVSLVARETRLQRALTTYLDERQANGEPQIDYVFVDCPPSLSLLTVNAFVAAREVLIPIQCEYYALEGLSQLLKHVELIRGHLNTTLHVSTILLTMYDGRTRLSAQVADEVREHFPDQVVKTSVPRSVRISEAPSHGQTVMTYDPASSGALSYLEAARELAEQVLTWTDLTTTEERV